MQKKKIIQELIEMNTICFLSSINKEGFPVTRAMLQPIKNEEDIFYFHTNTSSNKVQQYINNANACLYFCNERTFQGVTLLGNVDVLTKEEEKQKFWKKEYSVYYSNGRGVSDFTILKFTMISGSYYHDFVVQKL